LGTDGEDVSSAKQITLIHQKWHLSYGHFGSRRIRSIRCLDGSKASGKRGLESVYHFLDCYPMEAEGFNESSSKFEILFSKIGLSHRIFLVGGGTFRDIALGL
jgi:hypothetical protein